MAKHCLNVRSFAAFMGVLFFTEVLAGTLLRSILTTIERRFELSSTIVAMLSSSFQFGNLSVMVLVSYYGSRFNRPRVIAISCLLLVFGYIMSALPQFIGGRYTFEDISKNVSVSSGEQKITCDVNLDFSLINSTCDKVEDIKTSNSFYWMIMFGVFICGIGGASIQPLGFSYIDDHATEANAAFYIGIVLSLALLGPAIGYVFGSLILRIWVDIGWIDTSTITISPRNPNWVGAWWIGFLIAATGILIASIPFWFYPKSMEKEKMTEKQEKEFEDKKSKGEVMMRNHLNNSPKTDIGGIGAAFKRLFTNKLYVLVVVKWTCEAFQIGGWVTFIIKYLQVGFGKSASSSSFMIGTINLPFLMVGTIVGSFIIKKWKLSIVGMTKLSMFSAFAVVIFNFPLFFVGCDTIDTAGLTVPYQNSLGNVELSTTNVTNSCNADCNCKEGIYTPVCDQYGITYISPCHAGCNSYVTNENGTIIEFTGCSCVPLSDDSNITQTVTVGRCMVSKCEDSIWIVLFLSCLSGFCGGLNATPMFMMLLRTLEPQDKSFGIGMAYFVYRLLGFIPGPIIFGLAIDKTCLWWTEKPCSKTSFCSVYDNATYRTSFFALLLGFKMMAIICVCLYYRIAVKQEKEHKMNHEDENKRNSEDQTLLTDEKSDLPESVVFDKETIC